MAILSQKLTLIGYFWPETNLNRLFLVRNILEQGILDLNRLFLVKNQPESVIFGVQNQLLSLKMFEIDGYCPTSHERVKIVSFSPIISFTCKINAQKHQLRYLLRAWLPQKDPYGQLRTKKFYYKTFTSISSRCCSSVYR